MLSLPRRGTRAVALATTMLVVGMIYFTVLMSLTRSDLLMGQARQQRQALHRGYLATSGLNWGLEQANFTVGWPDTYTLGASPAGVIPTGAALHRSDPRADETAVWMERVGSTETFLLHSQVGTGSAAVRRTAQLDRDLPMSYTVFVAQASAEAVLNLKYYGHSARDWTVIKPPPRVDWTASPVQQYGGAYHYEQARASADGAGQLYMTFHGVSEAPTGMELWRYSLPDDTWYLLPQLKDRSNSVITRGVAGICRLGGDLVVVVNRDDPAPDEVYRLAGAETAGKRFDFAARSHTPVTPDFPDGPPTGSWQFVSEVPAVEADDYPGAPAGPARVNDITANGNDLLISRSYTGTSTVDITTRYLRYAVAENVWEKYPRLPLRCYLYRNNRIELGETGCLPRFPSTGVNVDQEGNLYVNYSPGVRTAQRELPTLYKFEEVRRHPLRGVWKLATVQLTPAQLLASRLGYSGVASNLRQLFIAMRGDGDLRLYAVPTGPLAEASDTLLPPPDNEAAAAVVAGNLQTTGSGDPGEFRVVAAGGRLLPAARSVFRLVSWY